MLLARALVSLLGLRLPSLFKGIRAQPAAAPAQLRPSPSPEILPAIMAPTNLASLLTFL